MMADAWSDLVRGFDGVDPPLDLLQRVREHGAGLQSPRHYRWRVPRAVGWAVAAVAAAAVVAALALAAHSRQGEPTAAPRGTVASQAKLAALRVSFASPSTYRRLPVSSGAAGIQGLPVPLPRPDSLLASDATLDSVWVTGNRNAVLIWKSGIVETIQLWRCNCSFDSEFSEAPPGFRHLMIGGSPALAHVSNPDAVSIGIQSPAMAKYGSPAVVETIRSGLRVVLYWYGRGALPRLLETARTLPVDDGFGQIIDDPRMVITGGTRAQQQLLRSIDRGIDSNDVPKVEIGSPPAPYDAKGGTWLTFRMAGLKNDSELGIWETWLAAGAFRELSRSHGLPYVSGFGQSFADSRPGTQEANDFPSDASHPTSNIDAETLTTTIERNLAKARLSLVSLRFAKPFNLAPIVIARTDDPRAGDQGWVPKLNPIGDDGELEGSFFEVVDVSGKVVFFVGHATRTQSGVGSTGHGHLPYIPTQ
jgi:hypothetical protein